MDVQCPACKTEYEFDDALVSERGTTVRCTHCAHQFKLRRPDSGSTATAPDRWRVQTAEGPEHTFTSLRELQRAIMSKHVRKNDLLTRGDGPRRQLGSIAELEPFFHAKASSRPPPPVGEGSGARATPPPPPMRSRMSTIPPPQNDVPGPRATQLGMGVPAQFRPQGATSTAPSTTTNGSAVVELAAMRRANANDEVTVTRSASGTLRPPATRSAVPPADDVPDSAMPVSSSAILDPPSEAQTIRRPPETAYQTHESGLPLPLNRAGVNRPKPPARLTSQPPPATDGHAPLPPPTIVVDTATPAIASGFDSLRPQNTFPPHDGPGLSSLGAPRRRVGGWLVAAALLAAVGIVGFAIARPYLASSPAPAASAVGLDPRAQQFLRDGDRALADGNLDLAKENLDKASALAEKDAQVLVAMARLAVVRADVPWLRLRLIPAEAASETDFTKRELAELGAKAKKAADDALAVAPEDPSALRSRIDAFRINGDKDGARAYVARVIGTASQPETAYALAALDLSETDPLWSTLIDRLRLAAAAEGNAGRARAALVYALARSGDGAAAKTELDKLFLTSRPHPLATTLRAFADKAPTVAKRHDAGAAAASGGVALSVDLSALPAAGGGGGGGGGGLPTDPRVALQHADVALRKGDYERARALFQSVVARNPSDSEALAGLGDVARAKRDMQGAGNYYRQALTANPTYLPALIGLGDVQWDLGDRATAQKTYKDIGERFPENAYPARVKARADGTSTMATPSAPPTASAAEDYGGAPQ